MESTYNQKVSFDGKDYLNFDEPKYQCYVP